MKAQQFFSISITLLSICCWISCDKEPFEENDRAALCTYRDSISAPPGYSIKFIDTLPKSANTQELRFPDDQLGYALASGAHGYVDVLKTVDGGYHWIDLKVDYKNYPRSIAFIGPDTGIVTLHDVTGCPNHCQNICAILRTTNGGSHWTKHDIPNFKGIIRYLAADQNNFFGILVYGFEETLIWSNNKGITWNKFPDAGISLENVEGLQVFHDNIYVLTKKFVFVIDLQGQLLRVMSIPEDNYYDLKIISEEHFILSTFDSMTVTTDGFQTTRALLKGYANLIGCSGLDHVVAVVNKSFCPTDVVQSNDLFAYTDDGGQTWTEGQLKTNLMLQFKASHQVSEDQYILILDRSVYELKRI